MFNYPELFYNLINVSTNFEIPQQKKYQEYWYEVIGEKLYHSHKLDIKLVNR